MKRNLLVSSLLVFALSLGAQSITTNMPKVKKESVSSPTNSPKMDVKPVSMAAKQSPALLSGRVKDVLSSKTLKNGSQLRVVKLDNGLIKKQIIPADKSLMLNNKISTQKNPHYLPSAKADEGSLYESFEGWDGTDPDWLPAGWTKESKTGMPPATEDIYGDVYNFTWKTDDGNYYVTPIDGAYNAHCQWAMPFETTDGSGNTVTITPPTSDEWLISPAVEVKDNYVWNFYIQMDPFWARFNYDTYEFTEMKTRVEALVSIDNGANWTELWNSDAYMMSFSDSLLWEITYFPWVYGRFDLKDYVGKTIKTAIRYIDNDGESVFVDKVTVGLLQPTAFYSYPAGFLVAGLSKYYSTYNSSLNAVIGNAYNPVQWTAQTMDAESVSWDFGPYGIKEEENPLVSIPYSYIEMPVLTATSGGGNATYQWGTTNPYLFSGGQLSDYLATKVEAGNYDLNRRYTRYTDINAEGMASFGTFKGVANYFEKPVTKYLVDTFFVHAGNLVAKAGEPVRLTIIKVDEDGYLSDTLTVAETYPEDFILAFNSGGYDYYTVPFTFKEVDPETHLETDTWLEIDSPILVEFDNYESGDMFFQYEDHIDGSNYAYITFEEGLLSLSYFDIYTSLLFDMSVYFPFLYTADDKYDAPVAGGTKAFEINTYWHPNGWWLAEELPDWITLGDFSLNSSTGVVTLPVQVAALPAGTTGRSGDVKISSYACDITLQIKQGDAYYSGIATATAVSGAKAVRQGDNFFLTYPAGTTSVSLYAVSGQKIASYALGKSGQFTLPAAKLTKGVYLLKFNGINQTIKILK
ncbi:MAG: hypothetical protein LBR64_03320 [Dysgonamonadaceae bacterium]|jgi:hypothetical protein|nr:hypothetical protein [Dysgonamonadaceae bacterium]